MWSERSSAKGNEKSTRCEGGRQEKTQKRENVKLIKMKLSRTQGEGGSDGRWSGYRGER